MFMTLRRNMTVSTCILMFILVIRQVLTYQQLVVPYVTTAASSSVFQNYLPSRTVDGDYSQDIVSCSHTGIDATIREAWLRVDLGHVYSLNDVRFWYRNDRGSTALNTIRLRGYSIKISNSTNLSHAQTCYSDPGNQVLPTVLTNDCRGTSRFVWFYTTNVLYSGDTVPMLEICEVQIFGCQTGFYGENCSLTCDHCMNPSSCDIDSGECDISGCAHAGLQPLICTACAPGMFGGNCTGICSVHCQPPASCGFKDGNCTCEQGWKGSKCDTPACVAGKYGLNCFYLCGNCENNETCDHVTGSCPRHCAKGWKPSTRCDQPCDDGTFGVNCSETCTGNCDEGSTCDKSDGSCKNGCKSGWITKFCNETCVDGWFGYDCASQCSRNCYNSTVCDKETGNCPRGCTVGYVPPVCLHYAFNIKDEKSSLHRISLGAGIAMGIGICFLIFVLIFILKGLIRKHSTDEPYKTDDDNEDKNITKFSTGIPKEGNCSRNYAQYQNNSYVDLVDDPNGIVYEVIAQ